MDCQLKRIRINYEAFGEGKPVLVLHGSPLDHEETVFEYEEHFSKRGNLRRLYVDLPGCGKTPGPDWMDSRDQILEVLEEFIDAVLPGEPLILVGTSSGAYLARGLVFRRASQFHGVLLNVPVIVAEHSKRSRPPRTVLVRNPDIATAAEKENSRWLKAVAVVENPSTLEYARALARSVADEDFLDRLRLSFAFDIDKLAEPFKAPTLIITGRQDHVVGYRDVWHILEDYPRATFVVLDRAGHMALKEQPEICERLISDWLDRVQEWTASTAGSAVRLSS